MKTYLFNILDNIDKCIEKLQLTDNTKDIPEMFKVRNFIFNELVDLGLPTKEIKDYELNDDKYNYILITDDSGKCYRCRKNNLISNISFETDVRFKKDNNSKPQKTQEECKFNKKEQAKKAFNGLKDVDGSKKKYIPNEYTEMFDEDKKRNVENTEGQKEIIKTEYAETQDKSIEDVTPQKGVNEEPIKEDVSDTSITESKPSKKNTDNYYNSAMSGRIQTSLSLSDLTMCLKDVTLCNPADNTAKIVNLTAVPLIVDDFAEKIPIIVCADGMGDNLIYNCSDMENPIVKLVTNSETIGISGKMKNGEFSLDVTGLSDVVIKNNSEDEITYNNLNNNIGHCLTEIPTPSGRTVSIHTFPLQFNNNKKGSADSIIYIDNGSNKIIRHTNSENCIYVYHDREFDAKIMCFWNASLFSTTVDVKPKE